MTMSISTPMAPLSGYAAGPSRKRRLSSASLSSTTSAPSPSVSASGLSSGDAALGSSALSGADADVDADGDVSLGDSDGVSGDGLRASRVGAGMNAQGPQPHDSGHRLKRRRKLGHANVDTAAPVSRSFEGMMLDGEEDEAIRRGYTVQSPTSPAEQAPHPALPFSAAATKGGITSENGFLLAEPLEDQRSHADADGDVALMEDEDVTRADDFGRPEVVEPAMAPIGARHSGRPRGKGWYEPEKDRIVVTSLSDSDSSLPSSPRLGSRRFSPSASRVKHFDGGPSIIDLSAADQDGIIDLPPIDPSAIDTDANAMDAADLAQPGPNGFTVSPSLLARLTRAQLFAPKPSPPTARGHDRSKSLVMYRPLRAAPAEWRSGSGSAWGASGAGMAWDEDVDLDADDEAERDAAGRIEEIDDEDEHDGMAHGRVDDVDMEVDEGLVENVDSMDIG